MTAPCPICKRPAQERTRPFCSLRCSEVDLGRWFIGAYAIPDDTGPDATDAEDIPGRVDPA
jgi:endogenous inhibitor of DNA gyrase (YacG/DUF329 family)